MEMATLDNKMEPMERVMYRMVSKDYDEDNNVWGIYIGKESQGYMIVAAGEKNKILTLRPVAFYFSEIPFVVNNREGKYPIRLDVPIGEERVLFGNEFNGEYLVDLLERNFTERFERFFNGNKRKGKGIKSLKGNLK